MFTFRGSNSWPRITMGKSAVPNALSSKFQFVLPVIFVHSWTLGLIF